ncbi:hypothetical protein KZ483_13445 [Paenibacillus sp. sptzw28]|uniref:hypothetical protein n=1 Tax=Paenibacillus sp. sptzw28 TaxID=715179 RepID=UPI001C6DE4CD|nr:hypothetical protein [Paenibacillus sp. sptzw28]QYR23800.1 hypothetical protein KZ483_13445 [Paenibacillus sp. sptzw28]
MGRNAAGVQSFGLSGDILLRVAAQMLPFYRKIAFNKTFADAWSKAVRELDLDTMEQAFKSASPSAPVDGLSVNGIGYFIDFRLPKPVIQYTNGTALQLGKARFEFSTPIHRSIARAVLPLYRALSRFSAYASAVAAAIRRKDSRSLQRLISVRVRTKALQSVKIKYSGINLEFKYKSSKLAYNNMLYRESSISGI